MEPREVAAKRLVMKHAADFFLRTTVALSDLFHGNLLDAVVFMAIARANVQHLDHSPVGGQADPDGVFPDRLRRPVSVLSVANSLDLSYETTRRHVSALVDAGYCVRVGRKGVLAPAEVIRRPQFDGFADETRRGLNILARGLKRTPDLVLDI